MFRLKISQSNQIRTEMQKRCFNPYFGPKVAMVSTGTILIARKNAKSCHWRNSAHTPFLPTAGNPFSGGSWGGGEGRALPSVQFFINA